MKIKIEGKSESFTHNKVEELRKKLTTGEVIEVDIDGVKWRGLLAHMRFAKDRKTYDDAPWLVHSTYMHVGIIANPIPCDECIHYQNKDTKVCPCLNYEHFERAKGGEKQK